VYIKSMKNLLLLVTSVVFITSCGGGGGGSSPAPTPTSATANLTLNNAKGYVGGTVTVTWSSRMHLVALHQMHGAEQKQQVAQNHSL
jgi:hypothetical protein